MKRIFFVIMLCLFFGSAVFAQGNSGQVNFLPLVSFENIFIDVAGVFTDILKEGYVLFISLAVIVLLLKYFEAFMGDNAKFKEIELQKEREARIAKQVQRIEDKRETSRIVRQREIERSGYVGNFEMEYASRELQQKFGNQSDKEIYRDSEGNQYEILRHDDVVEYVEYEFHYESEKAPKFQQDDSGYWIPVSASSNDDDKEDEELSIQEEEELKDWFRAFYTEYYNDEEGEPKERDARTGISRERISRHRDQDGEEYSGY